MEAGAEGARRAAVPGIVHQGENVVSVHDLHATMLALMGIDHRRLNTKFQGLDARLTGIAGNVVKRVRA